MWNSCYRQIGKRVFDLLVSIPLLVALLPLLGVLALLTRINLGRNVVFRQKRPGLFGREFTIFKFRTMTDQCDESGRQLSDQERLTKFGQFLRSTSLDELPELWNVVCGSMSLVGPRPLLPEYMLSYSDTQLRRHEVRPGITGLAQVNGRNQISWEERFRLDVEYVDQYGLWQDLWILWRTAMTVFRREGISAVGHATMPPFSRQSSDDSSAEMSSAHSQRDPVIAIDADKSAIVLGAGGHAKVVISTLHSAGYRVIAVYDDNSALHGTMFQNVPVAGSISQAQSLAGQHAVLGIGDITIRRRLVSGSRLHWISVVSPEACVHESVSLGAGTVVVAGAIVQPDCTIGSHVIVNTGASIDHDSRIEDFSHVAPGATLAGGVRIGTATLVGTAACVAPGVVVGSDTVVGAGAVVVTQLPDGVVAIGCPARQVRPRVPANVVVQSAEWGKKRAA